LAGTNSRDFHAYRNSLGWSQDDWRNDRSQVQYYHISGKQSIDSTIGLVRAVIQPTCYQQGRGNICRPMEGFNAIAKTPGDGTVPMLSASRYLKGKADYNAPAAT